MKTCQTTVEPLDPVINRQQEIGRIKRLFNWIKQGVTELPFWVRINWLHGITKTAYERGGVAFRQVSSYYKTVLVWTIISLCHPFSKPA